MRSQLIKIIEVMSSLRAPAKVDRLYDLESLNMKFKQELSSHLVAGWRSLERTYCKDRKVKFNEELNKTYTFQRWIQREVDSSSE